MKRSTSMLRRHLPADSENRSGQSTPRTYSRISLWAFTRRDPEFIHHFPQIMEQLARHLSMRQAGLYLRSDQARDNNLNDLPAADQWWKRQWRVSRQGHDLFVFPKDDPQDL